MVEYVALIFLMLAFALVWAFALPMFTIGGLKPGELRERLIAWAVGTYTWHGEAIPGLKRGRPASLVLWVLRYDGIDADGSPVGERRKAKELKYAEEHTEGWWTNRPSDRYPPR